MLKDPGENLGEVFWGSLKCLLFPLPAVLTCWEEEEKWHAPVGKENALISRLWRPELMLPLYACSNFPLGSNLDV